MPTVYDAQCKGCDFHQRIVKRSNYAYRLAEPPDVFLWPQFAWCNSCRKVVQAEKLLITLEMNEWVEGRTNVKVCRDMERYRQMMASRVSAPRCLHCGSTDILADIGCIIHPECGSEIVLHHNGFARINGTDVYSPEGEYLVTVDSILVPGRGY